MIEIIKAAFNAGEVKTFLIQGEYVEILEALYPVDVAMMDRSGAQLSTMRNAEASYFSRPGKYEVIQVTSATAQTVRLFVGSGDAGTRRTSGDVSVIDGNKFRTTSGMAFCASFNPTSDATTGVAAYLYNTSSTKNLVVKSISVSLSVAQAYGVTWAGGVTGTLLPANNSIVSKSNQGISGAQVFVHTTGVMAASTSTSLMTGTLAANIVDRMVFSEPIVIRAGNALKIFGTAASTTITTVIEYYEDPV